MASAAPEKKGKGVARQGPPPPRCLVEGCNVDLTGAKAYYCRHKVCGTHSKSPKVVVAGMEQRFCQQCSRFHQLHEFDQGKRSCRRRLACHNERRRKPPPAPPSSHIRRMSSAFHENNNRFRGFLVDFTHPNLPALLQGTRLVGEASDQVHGHQYQSGLGAPSARALTHAAYPCMNDPVFSAPGIPPRTGGSDSSCALSLLSTQPWDSTRKENHRAVSARCSSSVDATEHVGENNCVASCWSSSSTSFEVRVNQVGQHGNGHFSGELELLVQGERQRVGLDPSEINLRAIHWSL